MCSRLLSAYFYYTESYFAHSICPQRPAIVLAVPGVEIFRLEAFGDALKKTPEYFSDNQRGAELQEQCSELLDIAVQKPE